MLVTTDSCRHQPACGDPESLRGPPDHRPKRHALMSKTGRLQPISLSPFAPLVEPTPPTPFTHRLPPGAAKVGGGAWADECAQPRRITSDLVSRRLADLLAEAEGFVACMGGCSKKVRKRMQLLMAILRVMVVTGRSWRGAILVGYCQNLALRCWRAAPVKGSEFRRGVIHCPVNSTAATEAW